MTVKSSEETYFVDLTEGRELVVNGIATGGFWGSQHVMCLSTTRAGVDENGALRAETAIVARLRFDNDVAKQLRDALDQQIAALVAPPKETAN
ncbi:hypothetical protein [Pararhizobium sp. DWP1-1-3]|uniref:hypothetical protein n=1 Tax=Pararhizobium sp. DWP1-1-3 TaxID=2804652 RepID=UPI003CEA6846